MIPKKGKKLGIKGVSKGKKNANSAKARKGLMGQKKRKKGKKSAKDKGQIIDSRSQAVSRVSTLDEYLYPGKDLDIYTDTSYTSASWVTIEDGEFHERRKKKNSFKDDGGFKIGVSILKAKEKRKKGKKGRKGKKGKKGKKGEKRNKRRKGKKGKRGKKGKKGDGVPKFEKPKNWKTLMAAQRKKWMNDQIAQRLAAKEAEKAAWIAAAPERRAARELVIKLRIGKESTEQDVRNEMLAKNIKKFTEYWNKKVEHDVDVWNRAEWRKYLKCDGLPNPYIVDDLSTYLSKWEEQMPTCDVEMYALKLKEVLPVLDIVDDFIRNPQCFTDREISNLKWLRAELRAALSKTLDVCSYHILRGVEERMSRETLKIARLKRIVPAATLYLWAAVRLPVPQKPRPEEGQSTPVDFPEIKLSLVLPPAVDTFCAAIRIAWLKYDHLSMHASSFHIKNVPEHEPDNIDLLKMTQDEFSEVCAVEKEQTARTLDFYKATRLRIKEINKILDEAKYKPTMKVDEEREELEQLQMNEPEVLEVPRKIVIERNLQGLDDILESYKETLPESDVDLRRYRIVGGVILLHIFKQPPQTNFMMNGMDISVIPLPKELNEMTYEAEYTPPPPLEAGATRTPEEIELDLKRADEELGKLVLINLDLPESVLWLEPPVACQWHEPTKKWTTEYIHDVKYNEDKFTMGFRLGKLMPIAFAAYKYTNLPLQGWEMRPLPNGEGLLVSLTGLMVSVEFQVVKDRLTLLSLTNSPNTALQNIIGKQYKLSKFIQVLQRGALDVFPEKDAYVMVENCCPKMWPMERHTYHSMAFICLAFNMQWSRWNVSASKRNLVFQIREYTNINRLEELSMCLVTPLAATILKCNELSLEFSDEPRASVKFYPDLLSLGRMYGTMDARRIISNMDYLFIETVYELLCKMRLCSFS